MRCAGILQHRLPSPRRETEEHQKEEKYAPPVMADHVNVGIANAGHEQRWRKGGRAAQKLPTQPVEQPGQYDSEYPDRSANAGEVASPHAKEEGLNIK